MKREIKEKKKILAAAPEKKNSGAKALTRKAQPSAAKSKTVAELKPKTKSAGSKNSGAKAEAKKNIAASAKVVKQPEKMATAKSKIKKQPALSLNIKNNPQTKKAPVKQSVKPGAKTKPAVVRQKSAKLSTHKISVAPVEIKKPKANQKSAAVKFQAKPFVVKNAKPKPKKRAEIIAAKAEKPKTQKVTASAPAKKSKPQAKIVSPKVEKKTADRAKDEKVKTKAIVSVQKIKPQLKADKTKAVAVVQSVKPEAKKSKVISARKVESKLQPKASAKEVKLPKRKLKPEQMVEKAVETENKLESAPKKKIANKKVKPIGSAVFRGKKAKYDFQVFALDEKFEQIKAVYIISKRKTDRKKRGHHKLVCIDQTESIVDGIKSHKKDKCIRQSGANVICLLKEEDEKNRLRITADLRDAHTIVCNQQ